MNIENKVKSIMGGAVKRFAESEKTPTTKISIVVHTKNEQNLPEFYYLVNSIPKRDETGNIKSLDFTRDIMNKKFDLVVPNLVNHYFSQKFPFFEKVYSEKQVKSNNLYFIIHPTNETAEDFKVFLFSGKEKIQEMTINQLLEN